MFCKVVLLIVSGSCLTSATHNYEPWKYSVPEPLIQAFKPRGLKVSIPHTTGIQLFAFHGNINKPLHGILAGQLSQDILKRNGDHWIFSDPSVKLEIGDKIYYWLFVIKDNLGYRYDDGVFEIKDITPDSVIVDNDDSHATDADERVTSERSNPQKLDLDLRICEKVVLNLTQTLLNLQYEIDSLRDTNNILGDLVEKHPNTTRTLTLDGISANDSNPKITVQVIIKEKLNLPITIKNVVKMNNGTFRFQVSTLDEKITIIKTAKEKLKYSRYSITY